MDYVVERSVFQFSNSLILLKEVGFSVIFVLEHFTPPDLSGGLKLDTSLESTVSESMPAVSVSQKLDRSIKGSTVNQKVFPFLYVLLKFAYNTKDHYFSDSAFSNSKET